MIIAPDKCLSKRLNSWQNYKKFARWCAPPISIHKTEKLVRLIHSFPWVTDFVASAISGSGWRLSGFVIPEAIVIQAERTEIIIHW